MPVTVGHRVPDLLITKDLSWKFATYMTRGVESFGSPTIYAILRENGHKVNRKRIVRLMHEIGLHSKVVRRFKRTTRRCKDRDVAPDLLRQNFSTDAPNRSLRCHSSLGYKSPVAFEQQQRILV
jgi:transposase InsO family protein